MVLEHLGRQLYPADRLEIIVVCDGSTDGSAEMARSMSIAFPIRVFEQPNLGPAVARNRGLESARGPFVLFLDDDVMPSPTFVAEHARAHAEHSDLAVIGPLLPGPGQGPTWVNWEAEKLVEQYESMEAGIFDPTPYQFYTGNASVLLEAVMQAGGFDSEFVRAEDVELALRLEKAGTQFRFVPEAAAIHLANRSYASWIRAAYEYGKNDVALTHGQTTHSLDRLVDNMSERHPAMKMAMRLGLRFPTIGPVVGTLSWLIASSAPSVRVERLGYLACSLAFNFEYWRGVSDALGDRTKALALIERSSVA